jgi:hypothetical protein
MARIVKRFNTKEFREKASCNVCGGLALLNDDGTLRTHKGEYGEKCANREPMSLSRVKNYMNNG